jgi:hypothetical protein
MVTQQELHLEVRVNGAITEMFGIRHFASRHRGSHKICAALPDAPGTDVFQA